MKTLPPAATALQEKLARRLREAASQPLRLFSSLRRSDLRWTEQVATLSGQVAALQAEIRQIQTGEPSLRTMTQQMDRLAGQLARLEQSAGHQALLTGMALWDRIVSDPARLARKAIECSGQKYFSQNDEDGILIEIFRRIGIQHRTFAEIGVGDGRENNTLLWLRSGWRGVWIDGNAKQVAYIREHFAAEIKSGRLTVQEALVRTDNVSSLLEQSHLQGEIDLLSIDVDGNDYYLFEALKGVSPRVVVIEYNAKYPPPIRWSIPYNPAHQWDGTDFFGASLSALAALFAERGYQLVGCGVPGANAFFVRTDLVGDHFPSAGDVNLLYHPARYALAASLFGGLGGHPTSPRAGVDPYHR